MSTIYMSTTGNDSNSGLSADAAKLTFANTLTATEIVGDTIQLEDGIYRIGTHFTADGNYFKLYHNLTIQGQTTTGTIISGGPLHVHITDVAPLPTDVIAPRGLFCKYDKAESGNDRLKPDAPIKVSFNNISFIDIQQFATGPLFGTTGEDEFTFSNCVFQDIQVTECGLYASHEGGQGGFLGKAWTDPSEYTATVQPAGWNGRGIFKNTIFKRIWVIKGGPQPNWYHPNPNTVHEKTGIFQCFGTYLRFANCTIHMDQEEKAWQSAKTTITKNSYGAALLYAPCPAGKWMNPTTQVWAAKYSTVAAAYEAHEDSPTFEDLPVNDVKFINCHLEATGGNAPAGQYGNYTGNRPTRALSHAHGPYNQVEPYHKRPGGVTPPTFNAETPAGNNLGDYWPFSALSGTNVNSNGDNIWYNSEFINCSFNKYENGVGYAGRDIASQNWTTLGYCITSFTDCIGSVEFVPRSESASPPTFPLDIYTVTRPASADIDPLMIDETNNEYALRPSSPLISKGIPVPLSFYNIDTPSYQPSIYS